MDNARLRGLIGLTVRARQAVFGEDGCLKCIRAGNCGVLLLEARASQATTGKYRGACEHAGVPLGILPDDMLLEAAGRPGVAMAVLKGGLAQQIISLLPQAEAQPMKSSNNGGGASVE